MRKSSSSNASVNRVHEYRVKELKILRSTGGLECSSIGEEGVAEPVVEVRTENGKTTLYQIVARTVQWP